MRESCETVHRALRALPDELRQMLTAKHLTRMSYAELAEHFGVTEQVVAEQLCRARKMIRESMQETGR